ncbi:MAG: molecular chaperone TorD family protein [Coriobacteriales bacterium]|jgi:TorA maturation chaperone TorD|nr:molecular chaperone TorD family protein [Coriobacteriales bacterium]
MQEELQHYQTFFSLVGRVLHRFPSRGLYVTLVENRLFQALPIDVDDAEFARGAALLAAWDEQLGGKLDEEAYKDLLADNTRLFVGLQEMTCPPWESFYFNTDRQIFQSQTREVRDWYRRHGLNIEKLHQEPDDHIGLELEFVAMLLERALSAPGDERDAIIYDARMFIEEHPGRWVGIWAKQVSKEARTDFYKGLAAIIPAAINRIHRLQKDRRPARPPCVLQPEKPI